MVKQINTLNVPGARMESKDQESNLTGKLIEVFESLSVPSLEKLINTMGLNSQDLIEEEAFELGRLPESRILVDEPGDMMRGAAFESFIVDLDSEITEFIGVGWTTEQLVDKLNKVDGWAVFCSFQDIAKALEKVRITAQSSVSHN